MQKILEIANDASASMIISAYVEDFSEYRKIRSPDSRADSIMASSHEYKARLFFFVYYYFYSRVAVHRYRRTMVWTQV